MSLTTTRSERSSAAIQLGYLRMLARQATPKPASQPSRGVFGVVPQAVEASGTASSAAGPGSTAAWWTGLSLPRENILQSITVGERTELARYQVRSGVRALYGQRANGCVRITDRPAIGQGRSYLVERALEQGNYGALKALVTDYIGQAHELDAIPMASSVIRRHLLLRA